LSLEGKILSIATYEKHPFGIKLDLVLSPSHPVDTIEKLFGRERELETIERALFRTGTHIFIHGDRGVGKSSLAATAAIQYQTSDRAPIIVGGSKDDTFKTIIANIANQALGRNRLESVKKQSSAGFEWRGIKWNQGEEVSTKDISSQIEAVSDAVELLKQVAARIEGKPIVVIDEFDAIGDMDERNKFASLLKHLGDQQVNIKFIFTAVGDTLDQLLGAHQSAYRQLECVHLDRLGWDGRMDIVRRAVKAFGIELDENVNWRIAAVSDGFPYYIHEITNKMLWAAFADDEAVETVSWQHYTEGLHAAILAITPELRRPYDKAVLHRDKEYEDIVWSTADGEELFRSIASMHQSYKMVAEQRAHSVDIDAKRFGEYLRKLKQSAFGEVLVQVEGRPGWYSYKEKMLRGYVRMQADANGVDLKGDYHIPKQQIYVSVNARTGYRGSSVPKGVDVNRKFGNNE
jgi:AAA+ ATPase superfamily predicted ATPase